MELQLKRDVTKEECSWLEKDLKKGDIVYKYTKHTYGAISPTGIACSKEEGKDPFFEVPVDAFKLEGNIDRNKCGKLIIPKFLLLTNDFVDLFKQLEFIPFRVEFLFISDSFEYFGYSPLFKPVPEEEMFPEYEIQVDSIKRKVSVYEIAR